MRSASLDAAPAVSSSGKARGKAGAPGAARVTADIFQAVGIVSAPPGGGI
jgi:hypothetical protein